MTYVKLEDAVKAVEAHYNEMWHCRQIHHAEGNEDSVGRLDARCRTASQIAQALRSLPTDDGVTDEMVRTAAVAMWREESVRAAPNVVKQRTAEAFAQESEPTIARWTGLARAALEVALGATVSDGWEDIAEQVKAIYAQSECLEKYAEGEGFSAKPVPSVFHIQAAHFRAYANRIEAALGPLPAPPTIE